MQLHDQQKDTGTDSDTFTPRILQLLHSRGQTASLNKDVGFLAVTLTIFFWLNGAQKNVFKIHKHSLEQKKERYKEKQVRFFGLQGLSRETRSDFSGSYAYGQASADPEE